MRTAAVIVAAGKGLRMGGNIPKQYMTVCGKPILAHTLLAFDQSRTDEVIVVCPEGDEAYVNADIVERYGIRKVSAVVPGGKERFDSSWRGILAATGSATDKGERVTHILIHDGVRALITPRDIDHVIASLGDQKAVVPAVPIKDTIRRLTLDGYSDGVIDRAGLVSIQTPQGFERELLLDAYRAFYAHAESDPTVVSSVTDDAMLIEKYTDATVKLVDGSYRNIKITTPEDMDVAKAFLEKTDR